MKKMLLMLAVLLLAGPALAEVLITCQQTGGNEVTVSYDATSEPNLVRAFALKVTVDNGGIITGVTDYKVGESNSVSPGYGIFPGQIVIVDGNVTDYNTPVAESSYPGAGGTGIDTNSVVIEMGSLYVGEVNAPASSGDLFSFTINSGCNDVNVVITEEAIRGGVVMEDVVSTPDVNSPGVLVQFYPLAWDCPGHSSGDGTGDGKCNVFDRLLVQKAYGTNALVHPHGTAIGEYNCRADFTHDGKVNVFDRLKVQQNYGATGLGTCADLSCDCD